MCCERTQAIGRAPLAVSCCTLHISSNSFFILEPDWRETAGLGAPPNVRGKRVDCALRCVCVSVSVCARVCACVWTEGRRGGGGVTLQPLGFARRRANALPRTWTCQRVRYRAVKMPENGELGNRVLGWNFYCIAEHRSALPRINKSPSERFRAGVIALPVPEPCQQTALAVPLRQSTK